MKGHKRKRAGELLQARGHTAFLGLYAQETKETDPAQLLLNALAENRGEPLSPRDEGLAFQRLQKFGWSVEQIATQGGYSASHIYDCLTRLDASPAVNAAVDANQISQTDAVKIVRTAAKEGKAQADVLAHMIATKVDQRRKEAKAQPLPLQAARALTPLIDKFGLALVKAIVDGWPYDTEEDTA